LCLFHKIKNERVFVRRFDVNVLVFFSVFRFFIITRFKHHLLAKAKKDRFFPCRMELKKVAAMSNIVAKIRTINMSQNNLRSPLRSVMVFSRYSSTGSFPFRFPSIYKRCSEKKSTKNHSKRRGLRLKKNNKLEVLLSVCVFNAQIP